MGHLVRLHPAVVLFAVLAGGSIAGALGLLLSIPIAAVVRILLVYLYGKLFTASDFEEPPSLTDSPSSEAESEPEERRKVGSSPELARENMR
jgi:hypothetical protein